MMSKLCQKNRRAEKNPLGAVPTQVMDAFYKFLLRNYSEDKNLINYHFIMPLGCPKPRTCKESLFGCCPDGVSPAQGENEEGCPVIPCEETLFGCCTSDNKTAALGNDDEGCPAPCTVSK